MNLRSFSDDKEMVNCFRPFVDFDVVWCCECVEYGDLKINFLLFFLCLFYINERSKALKCDRISAIVILSMLFLLIFLFGRISIIFNPLFINK